MSLMQPDNRPKVRAQWRLVGDFNWGNNNVGVHYDKATNGPSIGPFSVVFQCNLDILQKMRM